MTIFQRAIFPRAIATMNVACICIAVLLSSSMHRGLAQQQVDGQQPRQLDAEANRFDAEANRDLSTAASPSQGDSQSDSQDDGYRPYLGIAVDPISPAFASQLPNLIKKEQGVLITHIARGSPADAADLRPHDILVAYDDQRICCVEQLGRLLAGDQPGREVQLGIVRQAKLKTVTLTLGKRELREDLGGKERAETEKHAGTTNDHSDRSTSRATRQRPPARLPLVRNSSRSSAGTLNQPQQDYFGNYQDFYDTDQVDPKWRLFSRQPYNLGPFYRLYDYRYPGYPDYLYRHPYVSRFPLDHRRIGAPWYWYAPYY